MSGAPEVLYLEADDEVTSVVRRIRASSADAVVVVAPGRSRATSSVVALRLIGRAAEDEGRPVRVVGDALTRSLAAEAGLPAFATLDEARAGAAAEVADAAGVGGAELRRAEISVVRGTAADETAPTLVAAAAEPALRPPTSAGPDDPTRPVSTPRRPRPERRTPRGRAASSGRRRIPLLAAVLAGALALVAVGAGATVLPAASVTIVPRAETIGPAETILTVTDPSPDGGTVTDEIEVLPSGTYRVEEQAAGVVVLFNWNSVPVTVGAGTFVAAGEQAFATQVDVVVPRGRLTPAGTIAAGEAEVAVLAAAAGPAANVAADAIDTVVDASVDAQLRGFEENPQRRVTNPTATAGGALAEGPRIRAADVDEAVAELERRLRAAAAEESQSGDDISANGDLGEPTFEGVDGLAGTRDVERATIRGELSWNVLRTDHDTVASLAEAWLRADAALVPDGHRLVDGSVTVDVGQPTVAADTLRVPVTIRARSLADVGTAGIHDRIAGRSEADAEAALADLGAVDVRLWPGWVGTVPSMSWRVDVQVEPDPDATSEPSP